MVHSDEYQRALADNYLMLARAVIALAVADLVACRHRVAMREYVRRWYINEHGSIMLARCEEQLGRWCKDREGEILKFFSSGGGELALMANCYHYIKLAQSARISHRRLRKVAR